MVLPDRCSSFGLIQRSSMPQTRRGALPFTRRVSAPNRASLFPFSFVMGRTQASAIVQATPR
jgi:hypothetical protein